MINLFRNIIVYKSLYLASVRPHLDFVVQFRPSYYREGIGLLKLKHGERLYKDTLRNSSFVCFKKEDKFFLTCIP